MVGIGTLIVASAVAVKVADLRREICQLHREAYTDHLTGLQNRRSSEKRLREDLAKGGRGTNGRRQSLVLVTADLDGLKEINDQYGHEAGDQYLRAFARLVEANLRTGDWAGRMGGDEFVIAVWDNDDERALQTVVSRLLEITRSTVVELPGGHIVSLSASFGVAFSAHYSSEHEAEEQDHLRSARLYERADHALLQAKRAGKDRIVYA